MYLINLLNVKKVDLQYFKINALHKNKSFALHVKCKFDPYKIIFFLYLAAILDAILYIINLSMARKGRYPVFQNLVIQNLGLTLKNSQ